MKKCIDKKKLDGTLFRVFRCFGRDFSVYYQYSSEDGNTIPNYPDFTVDPMYTEDGMPFTLTVSDNCLQSASASGCDQVCGECGSCKYFLCESPGDPIGICRNKKLKKLV